MSDRCVSHCECQPRWASAYATERTRAETAEAALQLLQDVREGEVRRVLAAERERDEARVGSGGWRTEYEAARAARDAAEAELRGARGLLERWVAMGVRWPLAWQTKAWLARRTGEPPAEPLITVCSKCGAEIRGIAYLGGETDWKIVNERPLTPATTDPAAPPTTKEPT